MMARSAALGRLAELFGKGPGHPAFQETAHRPWPPPERPWVGRQSWHDLLFAHWPVPASALRRYVPAELRIEEHDGTSWVGVTSFRMTGVSLRGLPDLPWISHFTELNVRLYVEKDGKPGVWFLSLDADNPLAVATARATLGLPYVRARMSLQRRGADVEFHSERPRPPRAAFRAEYRATGEPRRAAPGTLEHFLTERYCLYTRLAGRLLGRLQIHHVPWPLQDAAARVDAADLLAAHGLSVSGEPLVHFARRLDVVLWPPERADA